VIQPDVIAPEVVSLALSPEVDGSVLSVSGLEKSYGDQVALHGVDLEVRPGEVVGLLGPNGAGKTTFASIVAGLVKPDAGTVLVAGVDAVLHPHQVRPLIGFAPQTTGVYEVLTVKDNLTFFGELAGIRGAKLRHRIADVTAALLLEELSSRPCQQLSGGEKRRVHMAIALMSRPRLLLLDEPTVGADILTRTALLEVIEQLAGEGAAVLYSTHYLPEIEALDAFVVLLDHGNVIARGPVDQLVAQHGVAALELRFDGSVPELSLNGLPIVREGQVIRIVTPELALATARVFEELGEEAQRLRSLDVIHPSLDSVFLALTGRRYDPDEEDQRVSTP
jgi:ABC-type multidrug transport system ATPase subunit